MPEQKPPLGPFFALQVGWRVFHAQGHCAEVAVRFALRTRQLMKPLPEGDWRLCGNGRITCAMCGQPFQEGCDMCLDGRG